MNRSAWKQHLWLWGMFVLFSTSLLGGCNEVTRYYEFTLQGKITVKQGAVGRGLIYLEVYVAESGEGILQQPLLLFDTFKLTQPGDFSVSVQYPLDLGKGLVVYAWYDANNNGRLCEPNEFNEWSGLVEVKNFPQRVVKIDLNMNERCAGPERMFPAK